MILIDNYIKVIENLYCSGMDCHEKANVLAMLKACKELNSRGIQTNQKAIIERALQFIKSRFDTVK